MQKIFVHRKLLNFNYANKMFFQDMQEQALNALY